ncbi:unnamed protein product [Heligmosomoides polygyrus]|uniref:ETF domain-containing protein n=1 Tax=Heligmosomoides polygyrus TaxID=6339 RepID=A0A183FM43_HELPZ|nr:unnamed protein product [Heligmosomoides polygyrus]
MCARLASLPIDRDLAFGTSKTLIGGLIAATLAETNAVNVVVFASDSALREGTPVTPVDKGIEGSHSNGTEA